MKRPKRRAPMIAACMLAIGATACDTGTDPDPDPADLPVGEGQIRIRMTGDVEDEHVMDLERPSDETGAARFDFLDRPGWTASYLSGRSVQASSGGTNAFLTLLIPGDFPPGSHAVGAADPGYVSLGTLTALSSALGQLLRETDQGTPSERLLFYPSTSGSLTITAARVEGTADDPRGSVQGTAHFSAQEHADEGDGMGGSRFVGTGRSVDIEVAFNVPAGITIMGSAGLTLSGGPFPADHAIEGPASGRVDPSPGLRVEIQAVDGEGGEVLVWIRLPTAAGTVPIGTEATAALEVVSTGFYAQAESGSVVITEYLAPTVAAPGRARGTLDLSFRVPDGEFAGELLPATGTFAVPLTSDGS